MIEVRARAYAFAALALPVLAGMAYLLAAGAPPAYLAVNGMALALAAGLIALAPGVASARGRQIALGAILVILFVPLITGPALSGVARWLPLGPVTLHAGMLFAPALAVLAAEEPEFAPAILSVALFAALLQPDMALAAALMLTAVGLYDATKDWRYGAFAIVAFPVALVAAVRGELPAQPFADRVIGTLARTDPLAAIGLLAALVVSFTLIVAALPGAAAPRKALAGALVGFSFAGLVSNYPSPFVGYGAAPILGFGLALGLLVASAAKRAGENRFPTAEPWD